MSDKTGEIMVEGYQWLCWILMYSVVSGLWDMEGRQVHRTRMPTIEDGFPREIS
jgi:hypothetical protein